MTFLRPHLRTLALLAALAMLCMAFVPAIGRWVRAAQGADFWAEVCTASGPQVVLASSANEGSGPAKSSVQQLDHCPWCAHMGAGLPPAEVRISMVLGGTTTHPALFYRAPARLFAWAPAQPRAPPALLA